tara:strand:+ start:263 stop:568 length:306 start_codon:yes stop_codon:yes gene_type:complete
MTKREQLEENVAYTSAAYYATYYAAYDAHDAWSKAKRELANYLKEQDNEKLERLQKAVVDTKAVAWYAVYDDGDYDATAYDAWSKARKNLSDYLKEQQDNG